MALFLFTKAALEGKAIDVYNYGKMKRDFTYVADIVKGIMKCVDNPATPNLTWDAKNPDPATSNAPYNAIEIKLGREIKKNLMPLQAGDVPSTYADVGDLVEDFGYKPNTSVNDGVARFVQWYMDYYKVKI